MLINLGWFSIRIRSIIWGKWKEGKEGNLIRFILIIMILIGEILSYCVSFSILVAKSWVGILLISVEFNRERYLRMSKLQGKCCYYLM
jgi:hypothetical protein